MLTNNVDVGGMARHILDVRPRIVIGNEEEEPIVELREEEPSVELRDSAYEDKYEAI